MIRFLSLAGVTDFDLVIDNVTRVQLSLNERIISVARIGSPLVVETRQTGLKEKIVTVECMADKDQYLSVANALVNWKDRVSEPVGNLFLFGNVFAEPLFLHRLDILPQSESWTRLTFNFKDHSLL
jgi:hypothetical protein